VKFGEYIDRGQEKVVKVNVDVLDSERRANNYKLQQYCGRAVKWVCVCVRACVRVCVCVCVCVNVIV